ncbi:ArsR/SmtB family transcription factor [Phytohabitans houttuyneae]|uniref:ArsR/SmtB family transcription factor n=1 Tax=Phytohabitans houttuyneae TaxID=1076126 RepID=UPI001FEC8F47|nr:winged helix-turn-helix domain-containing protein [Phytohabitans houttuyneae]
MIRVYFTPEDIGRVRLASSPDPLWETIFSLFRLRRPGPAPVFGRWRRDALRASRRADLEVLDPLVQGRYYPDFLTPAEGLRGLPTGLDALLATPVSRLRTDMTRLARLGRPLPAWTRRLAEGDRPTLTRVAAALRSHHEAVVAPIWPDALAAVEADRARRARVLLEQGCEGLLDSFRPMMRWAPPVLEIDVAFEQSLHLRGRGLLLVPSYLSWGSADLLRDPALPPVLVYPVEHDITLPAGTHLAALIGQTRTAVLESIGDGRTTTELARRVGVSIASASQHAAVLREARLIHTTRTGRAVLHTLTPLGAALLRTAAPPEA